MRISDWSSDVCSSDLPGSDRRQSRDPAFTNTVEARTVLDWSAVNGTGVSTAILPEAQNGLFDFTVSMGNGGPLLQQLQMLPAGDYVLEGHSRSEEHTSELQSLMRTSYAVFCLQKTYIHVIMTIFPKSSTCLSHPHCYR